MIRFAMSVALLLASNIAMSQAATIAWNISDDGLSVINQDFTRLRLDVELKVEFASAHGALVTADGVAVPVTGTCFDDGAGAVLCTLQVDYMTISMLLDGQTLTGPVSSKNQNGEVIDTAVLEF